LDERNEISEKNISESIDRIAWSATIKIVLKNKFLYLRFA